MYVKNNKPNKNETGRKITELGLKTNIAWVAEEKAVKYLMFLRLWEFKIRVASLIP